ncbi:MAG: GntR family transcriptional regulator [Comamonadaceae bacterium]|jgi:DNA-binding GntR family transcriptional regulator|nr:GntR family transcriptional regulator [Comamonadaceae bacterium]
MARPASIPAKRRFAAKKSAATATPASDPASPKDPPLSQQAYERIKGSILSFELRPGLFINETKLCELTGLGRMPVHQAIHRLQAEGLIEVIPRKGLVIRADSMQDIHALIEARLAIEPNIVALAAQRIQPDQVAQLRRLLKQSAALVDQSQRKAFSVIDRTFHGVVAQAAGNRILADTLRPLHERSDLMWHLRIMPADGLKVTQREHEAVLKAIVERDPQAAWKAMHAHLNSLQARILKASNY